MIEISISNKIYLKNLPPLIAKHIKKTLTLSNPVFFKMKAMGKKAWGMRAEIKYYEVTDDILLIPLGMKNRLINFLTENKQQYKIIKDERIIKKLTFELPAFELRDYQKPIIDSIFSGKEPKDGILSMTTGSGKTAMAIEITRRLGLNTTILVPNTVLLKQFADEYKKFTGYEVGVLSALKQEIKPITVSTYQILKREALKRQLTAQTSVLIVEECQGAPSKERKKLIQEFSPRYLFGISGSLGREDGQAKAINFLIGDVIEEYIGNQMKPKIELWNTKENIPFSINYHEMVDSQINNKSRNNLISAIIMEEMLHNRKMLVLTKRIEHYKLLEQMMMPYKNMYFIDSQDPERDKLLNGMKTGEIEYNIIFGTASLLAVGMDIPSLDTLIIACDMKSSVLTTQSAGRIMRIFAGKEHPKIIDLVDNKNYVFLKQSRERIKLYHEKGWEIKYIN